MWLEPAKLRRDVPLNVVCDGNSELAAYSVDAAHTVAAQLLPILQARFSAVTVSNSSPIAGQTWRMMDGLDGGSSADVDAAWIDGANNVLVIWETTNSIGFGGRTGAQAATDARDYMAHRLALRPGWKIIGLSTLPRQGAIGSYTVANFNAQLAIADAIMKANFRAWGGTAWIDVRCPGSPFGLADYSDGSFALNDALWNEPSGSRLHLTAAGYAFPVGLLAREVFNLTIH